MCVILQVILGVARMSSRSLYQQRAEITKALKIQPYSEIMYTFATTTGTTYFVVRLLLCLFCVRFEVHNIIFVSKYTSLRYGRVQFAV